MNPYYSADYNPDMTDAVYRRQAPYEEGGPLNVNTPRHMARLRVEARSHPLRHRPRPRRSTASGQYVPAGYNNVTQLPPTAYRPAAALPISATASRWAENILNFLAGKEE